MKLFSPKPHDFDKTLDWDDFAKMAAVWTLLWMWNITFYDEGDRYWIIFLGIVTMFAFGLNLARWWAEAEKRAAKREARARGFEPGTPVICRTRYSFGEGPPRSGTYHYATQAGDHAVMFSYGLLHFTLDEITLDTHEGGA